MKRRPLYGLERSDFLSGLYNRGSTYTRLAGAAFALTGVLGATLFLRQDVEASRFSQSPGGPIEYRMATWDAHAVAARFDSCQIGQEPVPGSVFTKPGERSTRQRIDFILRTTRNAAGSAAEARHAGDLKVTKDSGVVAYLIKQEASGQPTLGNIVDNAGNGFVAAVEKPESPVSLYPKTGYPEGTRVAVFATSAAESTGPGQSWHYRESHRTFCGVLETARAADGQITWRIGDLGPSPFPQEPSVQNCRLVPVADPASNSYTDECR